MITLPFLCEAGYGNLGDDLAVALISEKIRNIFGYDVDVRSVTMSQANVGHMPPYSGLSLIGPGTLLASNEGSWNQMLVLNVDRGWTLGCVGTGVAHQKDFGASSRGQWLLGRALHRSPLLWMRSRGSLKQVENAIKYYCEQTQHAPNHNAIKITGDPIPLFYKHNSERISDGKVLINFGYTAYCRGGWENVRNELCLLVHILKSGGYRPEAWPVWDLHDTWPLRYLVTDSGLDDFEPRKTISGMEHQVRSSSGVVAFRLHAGLFSLANGVPTVMIAYQGKVSEMCEDLDWPWVVDPSKPDLAEKIAEMLPRAIQDSVRLDAIRKRFELDAINAETSLESTITELIT